MFTLGSSSEVHITSVDSRIRVIDGVDLVHKFKGIGSTMFLMEEMRKRDGKKSCFDRASNDTNTLLLCN
ncbi:hypothetical protein LOK49_LG07G01024 [Camellia lanceoleosa]|uniref:Uncharacterized protein n=1 Tax=Camellia lanceoleosa TaxID=1840588 RepID=A0ACC0H3E6_9ERIC|nr:hypothetical protein LOK49_LG07G01024 [Camellia lanceoleosa]